MNFLYSEETLKALTEGSGGRYWA